MYVEQEGSATRKSCHFLGLWGDWGVRRSDLMSTLNYMSWKKQNTSHEHIPKILTLTKSLKATQTQNEIFHAKR